MSGESAACDSQYALHWRKNILPPLLLGYSPHDIYNLDETGLFYKCLPNKTLAFKGEKCHGGKHAKDRITVTPICNMTGTHKLPLVVIGMFANPRCFKNVHTLPVHYYHNKKAWMTTVIFNEMLVKLDNDFHAEGRNIVLFIDNCPSHKLLPDTVLKAIRIELLPPNFTSLLQPLDAGIIHSLKCAYRKRLMRQSIPYMEEHNEWRKIDVLEAINTISAAWLDDVKSETIAHYFRHAGFGQFELQADNTVAEVESSVDQMDEETNDADAEALFGSYVRTIQVITSGSAQFDGITASDYMNIDNDIVQVCGSDSEDEPEHSSSTADTEMNAENDVSLCTDEGSHSSADMQATEADDAKKENREAILRVRNLLQQSISIPAHMKENLSVNAALEYLLNEYALF